MGFKCEADKKTFRFPCHCDSACLLETADDGKMRSISRKFDYAVSLRDHVKEESGKEEAPGSILQ